MSTREFTGCCNSLFVLLGLWRIDLKAFPVDSSLFSAWKEMEPICRQLLRHAREGAGIPSPSGTEEMDEVMLDLLDSSGSYYTLEHVAYLLSLFAGAKKLLLFTYSKREMFLKETRPIFRRLLGELFHSLVALRIESIEAEPSRRRSPLRSGIESVLQDIRNLCPNDVSLPAPSLMFRQLATEWTSSEGVVHALKHGTPNDPVREIVGEIQALLQDGGDSAVNA